MIPCRWFLASLLLVPAATYAQSVDTCMSAQGVQAISICQNLLSNGSRSADVYWKLTSSLHQEGQQAEADSILNTALKLHPGNKNLTSLRDIIRSDNIEAKQLEKAARKNQTSRNKGALKIACRAKTSIAGMAACRRYLELTDEDGDLIRARIAELENRFAVPVTPPVNPPVAQSTPPGIDSADAVENGQVSSTPRPQIDNIPEQRRVKFKQNVTDLQIILNKLGFPAGNADGIPGQKTRDALSTFYQRAKLVERKTIDDETLADLRDQRIRLKNSGILLAQSRRSADDGDIELALSKLEQAETTTALFNSPKSYRQQLRDLLAQQDKPILSPQQTQGSPTQPKPKTPDAPPSTATSNPEAKPGTENNSAFEQLMAQIRLLENRLTTQKTVQSNQLSNMRSAVTLIVQ